MISLLSLLTAHAASNQVAVEVAWFSSRDPSFQFFSNNSVMPAFGVRGGYAVHPNVALVVGYRTGVVGGSVSGSSAYDDEESYYYDDSTSYYGSDNEFQAALWAHQISGGAKADVKVWKWLRPYAAITGVLSVGMVRMDDDASDDENLTQVQAFGVTGGFNTAAGLDFPITIRHKWAISPYLEMGYEWLAPMQFEDLGSVQFSGFSGAAGVGVHF